jgi:hypothetical protein
MAAAATEYWVDAWQRSILTWDLLRQRGNQYLEHEKSGNPPVLVFDYEMVVDGRSLPKPANYALLRIQPPAGCPKADAAKRPFVVIDPRAGHGPGIGGFKLDSEIGIALARMERWLVSDMNPAMAWVKWMAAAVRRQRQPVSEDNPLLQAEREASSRIEQALDQFRDVRDEASERMFKAIYESPWLAAAVGLDADGTGRRGARASSWEHEELRRMKRQEAEAHVEQGTPLDAWARLLLYVARAEKVADERPFNLLQQLIKQAKPENIPTLAAMKAAIKRQAFVLALDEERAIAALPRLAPDVDERRRGFDAARAVVGARGEITPYQEERLRRVAAVLGLDKPVRVRRSA